MNSYELVTAITALAVSIAQDYPDNTELDVLGSIFVQLGETLETIALQREQNKRERREDRRRRDEAEEARRFQLRRQKKKEKHRGR